MRWDEFLLNGGRRWGHLGAKNVFLNVIHIVESVSLKVAKCSTSESIPLLHKSYNHCHLFVDLFACLSRADPASTHCADSG